ALGSVSKRFCARVGRHRLRQEQSAKLGSVGGVKDASQVLDSQGTYGVFISTPPLRHRIFLPPTPPLRNAHPPAPNHPLTTALPPALTRLSLPGASIR